MATLVDRLDDVLGAAAAAPLAEVFGIHTVEDLLRHYPHRYMTHGSELGEKEPPRGNTSPSSPPWNRPPCVR